MCRVRGKRFIEGCSNISKVEVRFCCQNKMSLTLSGFKPATPKSWYSVEVHVRYRYNQSRELLILLSKINSQLSTYFESSTQRNACRIWKAWIAVVTDNAWHDHYEGFWWHISLSCPTIRNTEDRIKYSHK